METEGARGLVEQPLPRVRRDPVLEARSLRTSSLRSLDDDRVEPEAREESGVEERQPRPHDDGRKDHGHDHRWHRRDRSSQHLHARHESVGLREVAGGLARREAGVRIRHGRGPHGEGRSRHRSRGVQGTALGSAHGASGAFRPFHGALPEEVRPHEPGAHRGDAPPPSPQSGTPRSPRGRRQERRTAPFEAGPRQGRQSYQGRSPPSSPRRSSRPWAPLSTSARGTSPRAVSVERPSSSAFSCAPTARRT